MNLTDSDTLKFMKGTPYLFEDICAIFPATLGQIVDEGYDEFEKYLGILTATKPTTSDNDDELAELMKLLSDFQYILMLATLDLQINQTMKAAFHFFTHENAFFLMDPPQIILGPLEEKHIITEEKFYDFLRILRRMYFLETEGDEIIIYADDLPQVRRLKEKMRRDRERVRKAKAKLNKEKGGGDMKLSDLIGSMTINDCGLNMANIWDITYYAFHDQLKRMGWRDLFNINLKAALAGAKLKKSELKHWMRSIASSDK